MGNWKCFCFEHNSIIQSTLLLPPDSFSLVWLEQARLIGSFSYMALGPNLFIFTSPASVTKRARLRTNQDARICLETTLHYNKV